MKLTIGSLFSGIDGLALGLESEGLGPVEWQVEIDPFCREILAKHWPQTKRFADVRTARSLPHVAVVCGGFPCQDVSSAGKGAGLDGARSGLWREFARIVGEVKPRFVVVENVASGKSRWLPTVRRDLHMLGYGSIAIALSALDVGAPHRRSRIFVVADSERLHVRDEQQWFAPRSPDRVRDQGEDEPRDDGSSRDALAHASLVGGDRERPSHEQAEGEGRDAPPRRRTRLGGWPALSPVRGVAYGVSDRLERLVALGNAIVPQCGASIGRFVMELAA